MMAPAQKSSDSDTTLIATSASTSELRGLAKQGQLYAVVDASDAPLIPAKAKELGKQRAICLYTGGDETTYESVAPYLFRLDPDVLEWVTTDLRAIPAWGIFAVADINLEGLRRHFRRYLVVLSPAGQKMNFRFYDPRVLTTFLDCCTKTDLDEFYGPVDRFGISPDDGVGALLFRRRTPSIAKRRSDILVKMRPAQMRAFARASEERFGERIINFLQMQFEEAGTIPRSDLKLAVGNQIARARRYGFDTEAQLCTYVIAAWLLGPEFDTDMPPVQEILMSRLHTLDDKAAQLADFTEKLFRTLEEA